MGSTNFRDKAGTDELSEGDLVLPATGHDWDEWETAKEATEQQEGQQVRFCLHDPSYKQTRSVPALPHKHTMVKTGKVAPNCTEDGNIMYYTCSGCDCVFTDRAGTHEIDPLDTVLPAKGHTWDAGKVVENATTTGARTMVYTCTTCGLTKTEAIAEIVKKANPLTIKGKTVTVKSTDVKKANQKLAVSKIIALKKKGKGELAYKKVSGNSKIKINKTTGKVTVKKGLEPGIYKVTMAVKAAGDALYKASTWKPVTFKVIVANDSSLAASRLARL